jgi:hypothetical protein
MAERTLVEAVNDALRTEMERDGDVLVLGEDVGRAGGVFRATAGLRDRFGADRCVDTPLAEAGILGTAVGLCMAGWRPVCEMQYDAFSYPALDQLITHVGRYRWRTGGKMEFPLTVRMPYGGGVRAPELHDDSPETYYVHTPGVKVAIPSTPADAKGLLAAAIREPDPVVILEPQLHYRTMRGEVPEGEYTVPLGEARLAREGTDVTLVAYGSMVPLCEQAADERPWALTFRRGGEGQWRLRRRKGAAPFQSADADSARVWWSDVGVHQNLTFPPQPDPVSGMHCWLQRVRVGPAEPGDDIGDIAVDTAKSFETYRRWLAMTRPGPGPGGLRRPLWFARPVKPAAVAYRGSDR